MPHPKTLDSYAPERDYFNRALESERGIAIRLASHGPAVNLRQRLYTFRKLLREDSEGVSPYDGLTVLLEDNVLKIIPAPPVEVADL